MEKLKANIVVPVKKNGVDQIYVVYLSVRFLLIFVVKWHLFMKQYKAHFNCPMRIKGFNILTFTKVINSST